MLSRNNDIDGRVLAWQYLHPVLFWTQGVTKADASVPKRPSHILLDPIIDKAQRTVGTL